MRRACGENETAGVVIGGYEWLVSINHPAGHAGRLPRVIERATAVVVASARRAYRARGITHDGEGEEQIVEHTESQISIDGSQAELQDQAISYVPRGVDSEGKTIYVPVRTYIERHPVERPDDKDYRDYK
jgi:hypothetical protein